MSVPAEQLEPYTYARGLRQTTNELYPPATPQDFGLRPTTPTPAADASARLTFSAALQAATAKAGRKLRQDEIEEVRQQYVDNHVVPNLWKQKGMSQGKFDALKGVFDNNSNRTIAEYLKQATEGGSGGPDPTDERGYLRGFGVGLKDTAATAATTAIGGVASGALSLLDYGARAGLEGINRLTGGTPGDGWSSRTFLGDASDSVARGTEAVEEALVSDETLAARRGFAQLIADDADASTITKYLADNPSALTGALGTTIGFLTPATLTRLGKVPGLLEKLEKGGRVSRATGKMIPIGAAGLPATGFGGGEFERNIMQMPVDALRQAPENDELYKLIEATGLKGDALERVFKEKVAARGLPMQLAAGAVSNLALPGLNPLAVERQIAGQIARSGNRLRRTAKSAAAEATEEAVAGAVDTVGGNAAANAATGQQIPLNRGMGVNVALGAGLGGLIGGAVALPNEAPPVQGNTNFPTPPTPAEIAAAAAAANTPTPAATTTNTPAPPAASGPGVTPETHAGALLSATRMAQTAAANKRSAVAKGIASAKDADDVVARARVMAATVPKFEQMTPIQQLDIVEGIATEFGKKASNVPMTNIASVLAGERTALTATPATPQVTPTTVPSNIQPTAPVTGPVPASLPVSQATTVGGQRPTLQPPPADVAVPYTAPPAPKYDYEAFFDTIIGGPKMSMPLIEDTLYEPAKAAYGRGEFKNAQEFQAWVENGGKPVAAPTPKVVPKPPAKGNKLRKAATPEPVPTVVETPAPAAVPETAALLNSLETLKELGYTVAQIKGMDAPTMENIVANKIAAPKPKLKKAVPKPPEKAAESKPAPLKKVPKPPKSQAPTPAPAVGAQETNSEAPTQTKAPNSAKRETATALAQRTMGDELGPEQVRELAAAIELAREGDAKPLNTLLRSYPKDDILLPPSVKSEILLGSASLGPAQRGETTKADTQAEAPYVEESIQEGAARVKNAIEGMNAEEALTWVAANGPNTAYRTIARAVLARLKQFQKAGAKITLSITELKPGTAGQNSLSFTNGALYSRIELSNDPNAKDPGTSWEVVLHEYIHAVASIIQHTNPQSKNANKSVLNFVKGTSELAKTAQGINELYLEVKSLLDDMPLTEVESRWPAFVRHYTRSNTLRNEREFLAWGLTNEHFQQVLKDLQVGTKSKISAWSRFVNILANALGISTQNESALERLLVLSDRMLTGDLDAWMNTVSTSGSFKDSFEGGIALVDEFGKKAPPKPISVSALQRIGETMANSTYGLERTEQEVRKLGGVVPADESPYYAGRKYTSDIAEITSIDTEEVVTPIATWIKQNWRKFGDTLEEFHKNSDQFLQAYHELHERIPDMWYQTVPLKNGQNIAREALIDQATDGTITPTEFYDKLKTLVKAHATQTIGEWAAKNPNSKQPGDVRKILEALKVKGYDENTLAEYNALFEPARQRIQEHMEASGRISPTDPWVKARGWKWYFPLKGSANVSEEAADNDYGSYKGHAKEFRSRNIQLAEGRKTFAGSVAEQLISDMNQEGMKRAEADLKATLFAFYQTHKQLMGETKVTVIEGTLKSGFTKTVRIRNKQTGKLENVVKSVPASQVYTEPTNGFVFHNGDSHFRIDLDMSNPVAAQLDRGVKGFRNVHTPKHPALRAIGAVTNFMSRSYTTYSPEWQFFIGFARDVNYIPATISVELFQNPLEAGTFVRGYAKRVFRNTAGVANLKRTFDELRGRKDLLKARTANDPFLQQLAAYRAAGGSTEFAQSMNPDVAFDALFGQAETKGVLGRTKQAYTKLNEVTSNWAQLLENKGRVAAFTTLVEDLGMDPKEAAAIVKGVMDFGQSGEYGRMINAFLAFYRVGATGTDVMRRAFTTKTGEADWKKLRNWSAFMGGVGSAAYMMLAMALGDDEDGEPRINKYDINTLTQKLILPTGDGEVAGYTIGLGLPQLLLAPGIIGAAYFNGRLSAREATDAMYEVITRNAPLQPAGWVPESGAQGFATSWFQGLSPTAIRPLVETTYNINAFDGPIHSRFYNKKKFKSEQGLGVTPDEWKDFAVEVRELTGGMVDLYPEDIRHFAKGYLGQPASAVMRLASDYDAKEQAGLDSRAVRTSLRIGVVDEDFYYNRELNRTMKVLENTQRRQEAAERAGTADVFNRDPDNKARLQALKALEKAKKGYYDSLTKIREANTSNEGKRLQRKRADSALRQAVESAQRVIEAND